MRRSTVVLVRLPLLLASCLLASCLLAGCGDDVASPPDGRPPVASSTASTPADLPEVVEWDGEDLAPPITLDLDGELVALTPWTACYGNGCFDGVARPPFHDVGERRAVPFSFPETGWEFSATFRMAGGDECARQITRPVEKTGERTWSITPMGPAGAWYVDVFGRGPGGDVITTFAWTTTIDGALPGPATGQAAVLADHDGELDSYGVEIGLQDLATQPRRATASVTVVGETGRSVRIEATKGKGCYAEGSLFFTAAVSEGRRAIALGDGPFTYDVELELDGTTYHGVGEWPTDESEETAPSVPLTWTPALPAYEG